jgi:hypothetical protein
MIKHCTMYILKDILRQQQIGLTQTNYGYHAKLVIWVWDSYKIMEPIARKNRKLNYNKPNT